MTLRKRIDKMKREILKGGLIVAGRNSGKSYAMAEILHENPKAVVVAGSEYVRQNMMRILKDLGEEHPERRVKRFPRDQFDEMVLRDKDVYVDEWWHGMYTGQFKAAVTSLPFDIRVVK